LTDGLATFINELQGCINLPVNANLSAEKDSHGRLRNYINTRIILVNTNLILRYALRKTGGVSNSRYYMLLLVLGWPRSIPRIFSFWRSVTVYRHIITMSGIF